jgi:uncharacterized protein YceH (UPF0502 family)
MIVRALSVTLIGALVLTAAAAVDAYRARADAARQIERIEHLRHELEMGRERLADRYVEIMQARP